jgi:hypothetical protein
MQIVSYWNVQYTWKEKRLRALLVALRRFSLDGDVSIPRISALMIITPSMPYCTFGKKLQNTVL